MNTLKHEKVSDDVWIQSFCYLDVKSMMSIHLSCTHFHSLTDHMKHNRINNCWAMHCVSLCTNLTTAGIQESDWKLFFKQLLHFLIDRNYITSKPYITANHVTIKYKYGMTNSQSRAQHSHDHYEDMMKSIKMNNLSIFQIIFIHAPTLNSYQLTRLINNATKYHAVNIFRCIFCKLYSILPSVLMIFLVYFEIDL